MAPVALPAGQSALSELQIEPVLLEESFVAADVAEREENLVAGTAADVVERHAERGRGCLRAHPEHQRRVVGQGCDERRRVGPAEWRQSLRVCGRSSEQQQGSGGEDFHEAAFCGCLASIPLRNGSTASMKACGWSILTACPAAGITAFCAPGIFAAM